MESFWLAMSEPPELPRSKIRSTRAVVSGRARSRATRRRKYSARDTPRSLARWRARRCISVSRVICVFAIIMAPSYCKSFPSSKVATGLEALPAKTLLWALLLGQLLRECTFHGVESLVRISGCRALLVSSIFSDDTLGYFTERLDVGRCREALLRVLRRAKRNKVFANSRFIGLAVDGSTGCRRRQAVPSRLCRSWKNAQEEVLGYRHHVVLLSVVGTGLALPVDVEPYGPEDSEYNAGSACSAVRWGRWDVVLRIMWWSTESLPPRRFCTRWAISGSPRLPGLRVTYPNCTRPPSGGFPR